MGTTAEPRRSLRETRQRDLVRATRTLFDARGMQHAPIEEVARSVGIARGLVYRQFSSKEELFVLTVTDYLDELVPLLEDAIAGARRPARRLAACTEAFARFCSRYPAFLDCTMSLMQRPARELHAMVSEAVWLQLGQGMAAGLTPVADVLRQGAESGDFALADPEYMANVLWVQALGIMHLARIGVGVRRAAPGVPALFSVDDERLIATCVDNALACVRG